MSYYRELRLDELVTWLLEKNPVVRLTDAEALQLATALLDKFDMLTHSKTAQQWVGGIVVRIVAVTRRTGLVTMILVNTDVTMGDLEVICMDCEEQWSPDTEPPHCICDDPADDAWLLYVKDKEGTWVRLMLDSIDARHYKEKGN